MIGCLILSNICRHVWISGFLSQKFAHPMLGYSVANFIEDEGSQAMCLAKVTSFDGPSVSVPVVKGPLEGTVKDIAGKRRT